MNPALTKITIKNNEYLKARVSVSKKGRAG